MIMNNPFPGSNVPVKRPDDEAPDAVNHPFHYTDKEIEVIEYIEDTLLPMEFTGYCMGNVIKYVSRWRLKGGVEDLKKAAVYLDWAVQAAEKETNPKYIKRYVGYLNRLINSNNDPNISASLADIENSIHSMIERGGGIV